MNNCHYRIKFVLVLLALAAILAYFIFRPFFFALALAAIFAVVFQPFYREILKIFRQRRTLAALAATITIIVFILTPLIFLGAQIVKESRQFYFFLTEDSGQHLVFNLFKDASNRLARFFPGISDFSSGFDTDKYLRQGTAWLWQNLGAIFSNLTKLCVSCFLFLVAFYYLLKDGGKLRQKIIDLSPLENADDEIILNKLTAAVNSVVRGNLIIAIIQGVSTTVGFALFGVANPVLWGTAAAIAALIPGIGTSLIIIPAIVYLLFVGKMISAVGLLIWGIIAVGLIDNFLGPKIVGRGMRLHPLLIMLSVLGGAVLWGPIGFLLGPLAASLFFALLDIYTYLLNKTTE